MPTYEVEAHGKTYEVEAPSPQAVAGALHLMPWEKDYGPTAAQGDFFHPVKPEPQHTVMGRVGSVLERLTQYPRIFAGEIGDAFHTLGRVAHGEVDAASPEAAGAALTVTGTLGPAGEFAGAGGQIARRFYRPGEANPAQVKPSAGMEAAQTAADLGAPLPAGIVSQTPGVQAFTQGFRQVPFVGPSITHRVGETVKAAGGRVGDIAEELSGGPVSDRATVGANTRQALQDLIETNNGKIDEAFSDLRNNHIDPDAVSKLPRTEAALQGILQERSIAGMKNPEAGLGDVANLVDKGTSFNGLQRARSDIGAMVRADAQNPNPGFHAGDMKRVYRAMTADLEDVARRNALVDPEEAAAAFRTANSTANELINRNTAIQRLIGNKSDEGMLGSIINSARDKTGNLRQLAELRGQLPSEDFNKIAGIALHELGHNASTGEFSLNQFVTSWNKMSPSAKSVLIADPAHRKALDDIAGLGAFLKDADKYRNTSNTSHAGGVIGGLVALGEAVRDPEQIPHMLGLLAGGYGLSRILGRPASASALRKWLTIARDKATGRYGLVESAGANAALRIAGRNLLNNLPERLASPMPNAQEDEHQQQTPIPRGDPRKIQGRYPYPQH